MGGSIRKDMVSKVTHLVAHKCGGDKYQYALTFRVPVMAASWVHNAWAMRAQIGFSAADPSNNVSLYTVKVYVCVCARMHVLSTYIGCYIQT